MRHIGQRLFLLTLIFLVTIPIVALDFANHDRPSDQNTPSTSAGVRVIPAEGAQGDSHSILVSGLQAGETVQVRIIQDETGAEVYAASGQANENGRLQLNIFTTQDDEPGTYTVGVINSSGATIGTTTLTIVPQISIHADLTINPDSALAGSTHMLTISGARPFSDLEILIFNSDEEQVFETRVRATVDGEAIIAYESTPRDGGDYTVSIREDTTEIASGQIMIEGPLFFAETVISPEMVEAGEAVEITVSGLEPNQVFIVEMQFLGNIIDTHEEAADADGTLTFSQSTSDALPGEYIVNILVDDEVISQASYMVSGDAVSMNIMPQAAPIDRTFVVSINGLEADETVVVELELNDKVFLTRDVVGNSDGSAILLLNEANGLIVGDFEVRALRDDVVVAYQEISVQQVIEETEEAPEPTPTPRPTVIPPPPADDVSVSVVPDVIHHGESFTIEVIGLEPGSAYIIDIVYEDEIVYTTTRTAGATTTTVVNLRSDGSEAFGVHTLNILQNGVVIASTTLTIAEGEAPPTEPADTTDDAVTISIEPPAGDIETDHVIRVTGLTPDETVTLDIRFGENSVYQTARTADASGAFELTITSQVGDAIGDYAVLVLRDGREIARSNLRVTGDAQPPATTPPPATDSEPTVTIMPDRTTVGESFTVTGYGLPANTTVTIDVQYGGASVFSTQRTTDAVGSVILNLETSQDDPEGTYTIIILQDGVELARNTLTLVAGGVVPPATATEPQPLETGSPSVMERLSRTRPTITYTFEGNAGETVLIALDTNDFDSLLILQNDRGQELVRSDSNDGMFDAQIGPHTLPYTGTYTVVVTSVAYSNHGEPVSGLFHFRMERVSVTPTSYGAANTITLTADASTQVLSFPAQAGEVISVMVNSNNGVDTLVRVIDPNGRILALDDDSGMGLDPELTRVVIPTNGTYALSISTFEMGASGSVTATINLDGMQTLGTETRTLQLNSKQSSNLLTLNGHAGETLNLNIHLIQGSVGFLTISVQQDDLTLMTYQTAGMPEDINLGFEVPEDGLVQIVVEDASTMGATLEFSVQRE